MTLLIFALIVIICYLLYQIHLLRLERGLRHLVAWCVTDNSASYRCGLSIKDYIRNAQINLEIPDKYRLSSDAEWKVAQEIIDHFLADRIQLYFEDRLNAVRSKYAVPGLDYFMYALSCYLEENQCEAYFMDHKMHKETLSYQSYGSWGAPLFDAKYSLSEFAIVYHKLFYIAYLHSKNSKAFNPKGDRFLDDNAIKQILDTKEIGISRM